MASAILEHLIQEIEALDPSDRAELRRRLDVSGNEATDRADEEQEAEEEFQRYLLAKGLILRIPDRRADSTTVDLPPLIEVKGEPVSETVIRERR